MNMNIYIGIVLVFKNANITKISFLLSRNLQF